MAASGIRSERFSLVILPTLSCDASCDYCFESKRDVTMDQDLLRLVFDRAAELVARTMVRSLHIYWQGGEILTLPPSYLREALAYAGVTLGGTATEVVHHLQTNLLGYGDDWGDIVREHFGGRISSSLDYPNVHRRSVSLTPQEYTRRWMDRMRAAVADGHTVNVVSIPNAATLAEGGAAFHDYFADEAAVRNVQVNLPFPGQGRPYPLDLGVEALTRFMLELYQVWRDRGRRLNLNPFAVLERRVRGDARELPCALSYACAHDLIAVGPDGAVAQCDCWLAGADGHVYGNIRNSTLAELLESPARRAFLTRPIKVFTETECGTCPWWPLCHGGCAIRAKAFSGRLDDRDHYCDLYRTLLDEVTRKAYDLRQEEVR